MMYYYSLSCPALYNVIKSSPTFISCNIKVIDALLIIIKLYNMCDSGTDHST